MATNREFLQAALDEQKAIRVDQVAKRDSAYALRTSLTNQLKAEQTYYLGLTPINISKKKASEQKQAQLKTAIAEQTNLINYWIGEIAKTDLKIADINKKIDAYDSALTTAMNNGLTETQATQVANTQIQSDVDTMQTRTEAQAEADSNKKLIRNILIAVFVLILIALAIYLYRKYSNKTQKS